MRHCPHTWFSTEFPAGKGLLKVRLRDLLISRRRRGAVPLTLALVLTLAGSSLAAFSPAPSPGEAPPEPVPAEPALVASCALSDLEPYVPAALWTPDTVPAGGMGEVLTEVTLSDGRQLVCYWEPGSDYTKYWALRQGDALLRFAVEDSAYAGGYSAEDFSSLLGQSGFVLTAPRGAAYTAQDYYVFDETGIPRLLAGCAQPVFSPDLDGDGMDDLLWYYHGGREAYCYLQWEGSLYQVNLLDCVREALPDWQGPGGWSSPEFSTASLFQDAAGTGLFFYGEENGALRSGCLRFRPGVVEVCVLPADSGQKTPDVRP